MSLNALRAKGSPAERMRALTALAGVALARGRMSDAKALLNERADIPERVTPEAALDDSLQLSFLDIWLGGQPQRGITRMEATLAATPIRSLARNEQPPYSKTLFGVASPYFIAASNYALANQPARARAMLAQYDADVRDTAWRRYLDPARSTAVGEVLLAEHRPLEAVAAFRHGDNWPDGAVNACSICLPIRLARAFDRAGMADSAIVMFERFLSNTDPPRMVIEYDGSYLAGTYHRLGELYEAKGDRVRASEYYRRFVVLWKQADPELQPRLADVQRRLARIGAAEGAKSH
jgi:tetratricopeptide (TPR) repeat protein